jgi:16S rRNA (adenine1518-N6/adenine1519-N6)-dimethyltransferase
VCSQPAVAAIEERLAHCKGILEIGPGPGVLTAPLSAHAEKMIALELDERMILALKESAPSAEVRKADALQTNLLSVLHELPEPRGLVSNLPYYITGPLLTRIAGARAGYSVAVLMMQKEVAERVLAAPKTSARGSLSVFLQLQFKIDKVIAVPAGSFVPPPKVDSTVLAFEPLPNPDDPWLFRVVRVGFTQPRKTLANNLTGLQISRDHALLAIEALGLLPTARPQELTLEEWQALAGRLTPPT